MSDPHAPFLRAIRERPGEDFPLLIFADYLEEQGDPRARFLRGNLFCEECLSQGIEPWYCPLLPLPGAKNRESGWQCSLCESRVVDLAAGRRHTLRWPMTGQVTAEAAATVGEVHWDLADDHTYRLRVNFYISERDWQSYTANLPEPPRQEELPGRALLVSRGATVRISDRGLTAEGGGPIVAGSRVLGPGGSPVGVALGEPQEGVVDLTITAPHITIRPSALEARVTPAPGGGGQEPDAIAAELNRYASGLQRYIALEGVTARRLEGEMVWAPEAAEIIERLYPGAPEPAPPEAWRDDVHYCDHCERDTPHDAHDSGHERDSSGDWRECLVCRWRYSGLTGRYSPP